MEQVVPARNATSTQFMRLAACAFAFSLVAAGELVGQATAAGPPTATTGAALNTTANSARLTGSVNPNGQSTTYSFQFGTTTAYGLQTSPQSAGSGAQDQAVANTVTGLDPGTTYHYRVIATNASGTTVGNDRTFKTAGPAPPPPRAPPPAATTGGAVGVGRNAATVRGTVNPRGAKTTYYFEVGLTAAYGRQTAHRSLAAANRTRSVRARLGRLQAGKTYHYRLVARNANGLGLGNDRTFTTSAPARARSVPAVTSRVTPRRDRRRPYRFKVRGRVIPPAGVSRSRACRGRVTIRFKSGRRTVRLRRARVSRRCGYRSRARIRVAARRHAVKLRVLVRFRGNGVLKPRSARTRIVRAG
jgi:hypothetical protein